MSNRKYILGIDYTVIDGKVIFSSNFLIKKGECCGSTCENCPYTEKFKGNKLLK